MKHLFTILGIVLLVALAILSIALAATGIFGATVGALVLLCLLSTGALTGAALLFSRLKRKG